MTKPLPSLGASQIKSDREPSVKAVHFAMTTKVLGGQKRVRPEESHAARGPVQRP